MSKPYIEIYQNQNDDLVIVYLGEVSIGEQTTPEYIVIKENHIDDVIEALEQHSTKEN